MGNFDPSTRASMSAVPSMNVHYFYMREYWVQLRTSPILYRYIDWTITVPLQMIEFYLILSAVSKDISQASFWKLLIGTIVMLVAGYAGEANMLDPWIGFIVGCSGWGYILFEIFAGEAGQVATKLSEANPYVVKSFGTMRIIVTAGWCIYPAGYFYGYLLGGVDDNSLNCIYNLADLSTRLVSALQFGNLPRRAQMQRRAAIK